MPDLTAVYAAVDREKDRFVTDLQRVVRQPSISSKNIGVRECAELLVEMMKDLGVDARVMETEGLPVVYGEIRTSVPNAPTLVIYNHYDVQPPDPVEEWTYPPFGAEIVDGVLYGRGATDAKGNLLAQLKALDAFRSAGVPLPCNIKFLFDGEEESGSPSLPGYVNKNLDLLKADAALSFDGGFDASDNPRVQFGSSGLLFVEIRAKGAEADLHSARARIVENPAWRIVWVLNKLKGPEGRINLPGFYDKIRPISESDRAALVKTGWDDVTQMRDLGVKSFLDGVTGLKAFEQLLFTPTCNIAGFATGYMGPGKKTVLPSRAACRLDFRLVADMDPNEILAKLRAFLDENGCADFEIESKGAVEPSRTALDNPFASVVCDAARSVYGREPGIRPTGDASGRQGVWLGGRLGGIPAASSSVGPPAWRGHAPDEFMKIDYYLRGIKFAATIWHNFGERHAAARS
jgi:acetylornithine deacetylase/succinyl-diaminopimelate desuccinylase-like protein